MTQCSDKFDDNMRCLLLDHSTTAETQQWQPSPKSPTYSD